MKISHNHTQPLSFYQLKLRSIPKIKFACSTSTDHYKNKYTFRKKIIEIALISNIGIYANVNGNEIYCPPNSLIIALPDLNCTLSAADSGIVQIESVAVEIDDFEFKRVNVEEFDTNIPESIDVLMLPFCLSLNDDYMHISKMFKLLIDNHLKNTTTSNYICISIWFEMMAYINNQYKKLLFPNNKDVKTAAYYTRKVEKYIQCNLGEEIRIKNIAVELNVTPNYLCGMFKRSTGKTIIEFLNIQRVKKVRELINSYDMTLAEIAEAVGLSNVRYLSDIFKKHYGISISQCKRIDNEISLYHQKPWDIENLDRDIWVD